MTKKVKDVIELLKADGWQYLGSKGDHHKFYKPGARRPIIVAGNKNRDTPQPFDCSLRSFFLKQNPRSIKYLQIDCHIRKYR